MPGQNITPLGETPEEYRAELAELAEEERQTLKERLMTLDMTLDTIKPKGTAVDGPAHYNGYQVLEAICDAGMARGFCLGNAVKYLLRAEKKGKDRQDLEKAQFYLNWFLERYDKYVGEENDEV